MQQSKDTGLKLVKIYTKWYHSNGGYITKDLTHKKKKGLRASSRAKMGPL